MKAPRNACVMCWNYKGVVIVSENVSEMDIQHVLYLKWLFSYIYLLSLWTLKSSTNDVSLVLREKGQWIYSGYVIVKCMMLLRNNKANFFLKKNNMLYLLIIVNNSQLFPSVISLYSLMLRTCHNYKSVPANFTCTLL